MKFSKLVQLTLFSVIAFSPAPAMAQAEFYDQYGIYPLTPKGPAYGLGAVMVGFFDATGKQLRVRTQGGEGLICSAKLKIKPAELKECTSPQPNVTNTQQRDRTIDLTVGFKQLLNVSGNAKYVRKVTAKVTDACLFQLSTVEAQNLLDSDTACLRAAQAERQRMSKDRLENRLAKPGDFLLLWQTTRALHANVEYTIDFTAGAGMSVKTEAAKVIKDIAGSVSGNVTNATSWSSKAPGCGSAWRRATTSNGIARRPRKRRSAPPSSAWPRTGRPWPRKSRSGPASPRPRRSLP